MSLAAPGFLPVPGSACPVAGLRPTPMPADGPPAAGVASRADDVALDPADRLVLPHGRRMVTQYATAADGARQLHLYYETHEVVFDEPDLFGFGETLARQSRFAAGDAVGWGEGYPWGRVGPLLAALLDQGILRRDDPTLGPVEPVGDRARPSPLPPAPCPAHRSWRDAEAITAELAGHAVEPGYLEVFLPVFRVAHAALDRDGRQVGEANVFPRPLRIAVPTDWVACIYPGTRYLADAPMNVTALKAMREHWPAMMRALAEIRRAFLVRDPGLALRPTVGGIERLAVAVLAVVSYQVARWDRPETPLDPVLSSLFRVTDGLRMVMHQMLFIPQGEPTLPPDAAVSSEMIHDYAERNHAFFSDTGVCAGPRLMVREFLDVLVEGRVPGHAASEPSAAVRAALDDVGAGIDYGLLGLQTHAIVFSLWPEMTRAYERIALCCADMAARLGADAPFGIVAVADRMALLRQRLAASPFLSRELWRAERDQVYADMYARCAAALAASPASTGAPFPAASGVPSLGDLIRPAPVAGREDLKRRIVARLGARLLGSGVDHAAGVTAAPSAPEATTAGVATHGDRMVPADLAALADLVLDYAARTQAILAAGEAAQAPVNRLLHRPTPRRPLTAVELDIHNRLAGHQPGRLPYLPAELAETFGLDLRIDSRGIALAGA